MTAIVLALLSVTPVQIIVPDVRVVGDLDPGQGSLVAEELARSLPTDAFRVTTSAQLATVLGLERQKQLLSCGDDSSSCTAELANALGAEVLTQTTVAKIDGGLRCNVVFISGRDGSSLDRISAEAPAFGALLERLHDEVEAAAARIFAKQRPGAALEPGRPGIRRSAWIPAVGSAVLLGTGAVLLGATANTWSTLSSRDGRVTDPVALGDSGRLTQTAGWVLCGVGAAALVSSVAIFVLGAPTPPRLVVAPVVSGGGGGLSFAMELP